MTSYFTNKLSTKKSNSSESLNIRNSSQIEMTPNSTHGSMKDDVSHPGHECMLSHESKSELGSVENFSNNNFYISNKIFPVESDMV